MSDRYKTEQELDAEEIFGVVRSEDLMEGFIADILNEANYWVGYRKTFEREIDDDFDLEDGLTLTKRAASLKVRAYKLRTDRKALIADREEAISQRKHTPEAEAEFQESMKALDESIILLGFEIRFQREKFVEYLSDMGIQVRTRFKARKKSEEEELD